MKLKYILALSSLLTFQACDSSSSSSNDPGVTPVNETPNVPSVGGQPSTNPSDPTLPQSPVEGETPVENSTDEPSIIPGNSFQLISGLKTSRSSFIKDLGVGVSGKIQSFAANAHALSDAGASYCGAPDAVKEDVLKSAFSKTMLDWQALELYQMGPMTEKNSSLKTKIYNWPIVPYLCKIDEESMYAREDGDAYVLPTDNNKIGLQAAEYLIFDTSLETGCPNGLTKTNWNALSRDDRRAARCAYLKPVLRDLAANADVLKNAWGTTDDNYLSRKVGNATLEQSAMQEMFNNILYIDIEMKNKKIGIPAGQDIKGCPKSPAPCVDKQELRYSRLSREALTANVNVLADLIFGIGEPRRGGLTAVLREENASVAASKSEANVASLLTLVESEQSNFDAILVAKENETCETSQASWICKVQKSIRTVVADFKDEYASVLKVQVPVEKQGDND